MVRVLFYVILVFLIAASAAWLADRPGTIILDWQGQEIRTSLLVAAVALIVLLVVLGVLGALIRAVLRSRQTFDAFLGRRRRDRGYRALSAGMIAIGAGDARTARKAAAESRALLAGEPLALLLAAQAAQLGGDANEARMAFEALAERPDTRVLGLHGLFIEARRHGSHEAASHFAEEAARIAPRIGWAGSALFEYRARAGDWLGALQILAANTNAKIVPKDAARRLRAVLLTARAMELEGGDPAEARALALEAHRLMPDLVPAATVASRLLTRAGEVRRAGRVLETTWKVMPHPEVAEAYAAVKPGDTVRDRLKRMRRLADLRPDVAESGLAVARAAIDALDWPAARAALRPLAELRPSERLCLLMAEIEEREHGDQGRVRVWLTRAMSAPRDPAWVADGHVFDRWAPVSPISGRVGAFEWKVTKEPSSGRTPLQIEAEKIALAPPPPASAVVEAEPPADSIDAEPALPAVVPAPPPEPVPPPPEPPPEAPAGMVERRPAGGGRHVPGPTRPPDDPGPPEDSEGPTRLF